MKLQCSCGAKYAFDVTPEMAQNPVRFVCPECGADSSDFVNEMVRRELGQAEVTPAVPAGGARLRILHEEKPAAQPQEEAPVSKYCQRHRGVLATEKCTVCHKPICPKCMEQFGFFCSPLCKNKADLQGIAARVYAGQKFEVEAQFWRKAGLIFGATVGVVVLLLGVWIWYAWFGSVPHAYFSVPFKDDPAYSGRAEIAGKDQLVFLHGGTLARYDLKSKKQVWSQELVSQQQLDDLTKESVAADARANAEDGNDGYRQVHTQAQIERAVKMTLHASLLLRVSGQNIWVGHRDKLTHYDWDTGKVVREITLPEAADALIEGDGELLVLGAQSVTHISLASGDTRVEQFLASGAEAPVASGSTAASGLPLAGADSGGALDPNQVANQAQNLKLPGRIALPALLGNAAYEQQLEAALNDNPQHPQRSNPPSAQPGAGSFELVPSANGFVEFSMRLLEQKTETRTATKEAPKKSALDGNVTTAQTADVANEILNGMQHDRGGDTVTEDVSRYQVTVHVPDPANTPDWTGEVTGPPQLFALKTVNVIAAGKNIIVLDKDNKKLWQTSLTYSVSGGAGEFFGMKSPYGDGPCVEHGDTLYVFDQAVLSAFDLATGNARWRLPSIGVVGLFFDDQGMVYVNTTSGNPDDVKYLRQIDITKTTEDVLMKLDPVSGKTLWSIKPGGFISYLSGKFIYTTQSFDPNPTDEEVLNDSLMGLEKPPYFRIARINPKNGRVMWEYYDSRDRVPFYVRFEGSTIELVFKREVEVLKYLAF